MNRLPLLGLAGTLFAIAPASAQTTMPDSMGTLSDSTMMADTTMTIRVVLDTDGARELNSEGNALTQTGAFDEALAKFDAALTADSTFAPAMYGRAIALGQLGRLEEAQATYMATIAASQAEALANVREASQKNLVAVEEAIVQRDSALAANAAVEADNAKISTQTAAIESATSRLIEFPVSAENAQAAYDDLERAREAGYDASLLAFQYAQALNALGRGAEALPLAQQALATAQADPEVTDLSAYYIQVGIANRFAGDDPGARVAFNEAKSGSWASWADYYLAEMGQPTSPN